LLKNIPNILSPDLLKILMEMGHGDELVIPKLSDLFVRIKNYAAKIVFWKFYTERYYLNLKNKSSFNQKHFRINTLRQIYKPPA
jgi:hypothetical protein